MALQPDLSDQQRSNLATLAAYLKTLPADYRGFNMADFTDDGDDVAHVPECGTVACAAGHGPAAGIKPNPEEDWFDYVSRVFLEEDSAENTAAWQWCFGYNWTHADNSAAGASERINWMLEHGVPDDAYEQMRGRAPLSYRSAAA